MNFLAEYGIFLLKMITILGGLLILFGGLFSMSKKSTKTDILIESFNNEYDLRHKQLIKALPSHKKDKTKKKKKLRTKQSEKSKKLKSRRFVIDFIGDIGATTVSNLRDQISMILSVATPKDEVVLRLESPGGIVSGYGLCASQLARIREKNIPLTVCIDKIAASGGYLMACVANQIIAAPFAIIGSIGVVAQMPNFHRLLKKNNIDIELITAGKYKRTLTMLGENTKQGRDKFQKDLESIHQIFQDHISTYRADLNIEEVATGEHWLAADAIQHKLIDHLKTSDDYLIESLDKYDTVVLSTPIKPTVLQKLTKPSVSKLKQWLGIDLYL